MNTDGQGDRFIVARYEVKSNSGNTYTVSLDGDGNYSCGCLGWTRHVPRRDCKHILWVIEFGPQEMDPLLASMRKVQRAHERKQLKASLVNPLKEVA